MIDLADDFRDMLLELADAGAEFALVGGYAVAFHGHPRATKDIDILVRASRDNAARVYRALAAFGAPLDAFEVAETDFADYDGVLQIGVAPLRIDILTRITAVDFEAVVADDDFFVLQGRQIPVIGRAALMKNKRAVGRPQDVADVAALETALERSE